MLHITAIIELRNNYGIPEEGFEKEEDALLCYKSLFRESKGEEFCGSLGFSYDSTRRSLEYKYQIKPDGVFIAYPYPLNDDIPFDRDVSDLATKLDIPEWLSPAARLIVLQRNALDDKIPQIPIWLTIAEVGMRLLFTLNENMSTRGWRDLGVILGMLPPQNGKTFIRGVVQGYGQGRKWGKKEQEYWETFIAYHEAIVRRREKGQKGKKGLLVETAQILKKDFKWEYIPDSYTVRRYLDRGQKMWHISTNTSE